ncbi:MAG: hypothetical protein GY949_04200 [Gammaproteobacteria bacterium]|nr:hypothetical protein [Gammaproteobacteria bacterium]
MTPDSETEEKIAETAFCWLDYDNYGSEEKAIKAFRRRKGMSKFDTETVQAWLSRAVGVRKRLDAIKAEISKSYGKASHYYLTKEEFEEGTETLTSRLNEEYPDLNATVSYMISMAWCMYYYR